MLKTALEMWDYRAAVAEGCEDAIRAVDELRPSAVLMDTGLLFVHDLVHMNLLSGGAKGIPVIVLSGFPQLIYRQAVLNNGATKMLIKPVDLDLLKNCLEECIVVGSGFERAQ
jgi:DNA-binding response OmpR family regulator